MRRLHSGALGGALLLGALTAMPAHAVDSAKPAVLPPCGLLFEDKANDQEENPDGQGLTTSKGQPNADVLGGWFSTDAAGKPVANLLISKLDKAQPATSTGSGMHWYFNYYLKGVHRMLHASTTGGDVSYVYGTIDDSTGIYTTDGETKGAFFEGDNGVIQMEIPADAGGAVGTAVTKVSAVSDGIQGFDDTAGFNIHLDESGVAAEGTIGPCTGTGGATPETPLTPVTPVTPGAAPATLPLKVGGSLRAAKKGKKVALRLTASKAISKLSISIKARNGKGAPFASATVASLRGSKTLKLTLKKALKKGTYVVQAKGTVDGKLLGSSTPLTVK